MYRPLNLLKLRKKHLIVHSIYRTTLCADILPVKSEKWKDWTNDQSNEIWQIEIIIMALSLAEDILLELRFVWLVQSQLISFPKFYMHRLNYGWSCYIDIYLIMSQWSGACYNCRWTGYTYLARLSVWYSEHVIQSWSGAKKLEYKNNQQSIIVQLQKWEGWKQCGLPPYESKIMMEMFHVNGGL